MKKQRYDHVFIPPALLEDEDSKELARMREKLRATLQPADGIEEMWMETLIVQIWPLRRLIKLEKEFDEQLLDCGGETDMAFNLAIGSKERVAQLIENVERRMRVTLGEIEHHKEFALRAKEVIALHSARHPALIEGRVSPPQPKAHTKRRHEAIVDEAAPSLVPEEGEDLELEEAAETPLSADGETDEPSDETFGEAEGEESPDFADDDSNDHEEEVGHEPDPTPNDDDES